MTLQKQLLLISLSIFILPWAGCQFVKEMDNTLREGQVTSLKAQSRAIAIALESSQPPLDFSSNINTKNSTTDQQIYFSHLKGAPIIDGYNSDWAEIFTNPRKFFDPESNDNSYFNLNAGVYGKKAYLAFSIRDLTQQFHNPQKLGISNGDHIILHTKDRFFRNINYVLQNSSSGNFIGYYLNESGTIKAQSAIKGFWRETSTGYIVEVGFPFELLNEYLSITYVDQHYFHKNSALNSTPNSTPQKIIEYSIDLENKISPYTEPGMSISIIDNNHWILAQTANHTKPAQDDSTFWLIKWLYKIILDNKHLPNANSEKLGNKNNDGRFIFDNAKQVLTGDQTSLWYQSNSELIARVTSPIYKKNHLNSKTIAAKTIAGYVIIEQSASSVAAATNAAFNRLFLITLGAMAFIIFTLLMFASILSFRIRRLRNATDTAIGTDGKINQHFIKSTAKDEVGDLTRSYKQLLERLDDYTEYLRTLASKLSHELRTPLAVIKSSLDNLDQEILNKKSWNQTMTEKTINEKHNIDAQHYQYIRRASEGAERLSNILNAMSAANRIEESIHDTQRTIFELDHLLKELVAAYQATYTGKNIQLNLKDGTDHKQTPPSFMLNGSPDLIVQMLDKLIDNAVDFCPENGVISFELKQSPSTRSSLILSVANTGPLLPSHMQGHLFDSLVSMRDENANTHPSSKTHLGLGLHIVRLIANFHHGHVTAQNLANKSGVVFIIELPAYQAS